MRILFFLLLAVARVEAGCLESDGSCTDWVDFGESRRLLVHRSHALTALDPEIERAVVVVHGSDSNADEYFSRIIDAAEDEGVIDRTLIVAPRFPHDPAAAEVNELYWLESSSSGNSWKQGDLSVGPGDGISSYEVMDRLVTILADDEQFPNLRVISVVGHSGGGQFVQRYAAGTGASTGFGGPRLAFVVANPSSYMYLDERRPLPGSTTEFAVPETSCSYNRFKYGLEQRNEYMERVGPDEIRAAYSDRFVTYLAGTEDTDPDDSNLDTSCRAAWQGPHRFARAAAYSNHVDAFYPGNLHRFVPVPEVGHSSTQMFRSPEGRASIFIDEIEIPIAGSLPSPPTGVTVE